jgi:hypothetical protein
MSNNVALKAEKDIKASLKLRSILRTKKVLLLAEIASLEHTIKWLESILNHQANSDQANPSHK